MLESAPLIAFVPCDDIDAARAFYRDTLGLRLVDDSPFAVAFDANGTPLRVTPVPDMAPRPGTTVGWTVHDIEATVDGLVERGVAFERYDGMEQDDRGIWTVPGTAVRVAWFLDPAGNTLSLTAFGR